MGFRRTCDFIIFFLKGEIVILFLGSNVSKEQKKKKKKKKIKHVLTTMSSPICDSLFLRPEICYRRNKKQKLQN